MRYISFIILLQIVCASTIFSQTSFVIDSICIQQLKIKDTNVYNYLEKELVRHKIKEDTLFLSFDSIGINQKRLKSDNKEYWYILDGENYNTNMRVFNYVGFVHINNICILIREDYGQYSKYMFDCEDTISYFYYYKDLSVKFPAYHAGSDVELVYKISKKRNNRYVIKRIN